MTIEVESSNINYSSQDQQEKPMKIDKKSMISFGFGALTDQMSHQAFQFLIFTYYYAIVGVSLGTLALSFMIFAIWDSVNDPLLGPISDRTKSKLGRRRFWVLVSIIPFALANVLIFTPFGDSEISKALYMIGSIMLYDLFFTIFSTNQTALFPEMFKTEEERGKANLYKNIMTIVGILIGFVLPTILISPMAPTESTSAEVVSQIPTMYLNTGIIIAIFVVIFGYLFFQFGMKEDSAENIKTDDMPPLLESIKTTLKNKTFILFVFANLFTWFVFKLLTTIIPLYGIHVLGIGDGDILLSVVLLVGFLSATGFFPVMEKLGYKYGVRKGFMISQFGWILAMIPFMFLDNQPVLAIICMIFVGFGLSGAMYFVDIIIAQIIDEDEIKTGLRREGSYYGVNALINRYSTILVFLAIAAVLSGYGWENYLLGSGLDYAGLKTGLKILMVGFTIGGLLLSLIFLKFYPITKEKYQEIQEKLKSKKEKTE